MGALFDPMSAIIQFVVIVAVMGGQIVLLRYGLRELMDPPFAIVSITFLSVAGVALVINLILAGDGRATSVKFVKATTIPAMIILLAGVVQSAAYAPLASIAGTLLITPATVSLLAKFWSKCSTSAAIPLQLFLTQMAAILMVASFGVLVAWISWVGVQNDWWWHQRVQESHIKGFECYSATAAGSYVGPSDCFPGFASWAAPTIVFTGGFGCSLVCYWLACQLRDALASSDGEDCDQGGIVRNRVIAFAGITLGVSTCLYAANASVASMSVFLAVGIMCDGVVFVAAVMDWVFGNIKETAEGEKNTTGL
jgi:hypothetical protein